jgi:hypothetical protein
MNIITGGYYLMKAKLLLFMFICTIGLGIAAMTGCKKEEKNPMEAALPLLLLNAGQQQSFFPVIPKGVAE